MTVPTIDSGDLPRRADGPRSSAESGHAERGVPYPLRLAAAYTWRIALIGIGVYALLRVMDFFRPLVVPLFVAVLLTALLHPLVVLLDRWLPRGIAVLITMLVALGVISGLFTLVGTQISSQMAQLTTQALDGFEKVRSWLAHGPFHLGSDQVGVYLAQLRDKLTANSQEIASQALSATATAGEVITGLVLALFTLAFLLLEGRRIWEWLLRFVPHHGRERADLAGQAGWKSLSAYVRATVLVAAVDALGIGIGAALIGVPLAIPLGVLVFLGAFIPIVGALISGAVAVLVALLALGWVKALIMLGIVVAVQQVESHLLQPFLMGRMVSVHALGVVFAIGAGVIIDGITGALFAVPLAAVLNTVVHVLASPPGPQTAAAVDRAGEQARRSSDDPATDGDTADDVTVATADDVTVATADDDALTGPDGESGAAAVTPRKASPR
jgi:predicted PurR-regulated permease PerM